MVGSDGRGVVVARGSQPFAVQQLACLCNSTENQPAVLESIKASIVVQRRRNTGNTLPLRPSDIRLHDFACATRANSHDASRVFGVKPCGSIRVPSFSRG